MKPKQNRAGTKSKSHTYDRCQTPYYALDPLLPYLECFKISYKLKNLDGKPFVIWESACGDGQIVKKLRLEDHTNEIIATDILTGHNFFTYEPKEWSIQITNCPYSIKYDWLRRSYELQRPFALLLPLETLGAATAQKLFSEYGIEIILLNKRINFNMPNKGYSGNGAQFPVAWFTWGLNIGQQLTYGKVTYYADEQGKLL